MKLRLVVLLGALLACRAQNDTQPAAAKPPATAPLPPPRGGSPEAGVAEAGEVFTTRCAVCHGAEGQGDGQAAASLDPKPRDFTDAAWQATVTDAEVRTIIVKGGGAVSKSPLMAANPDLQDKDAVLAALVHRVRSFARQRKAQ